MFYMSFPYLYPLEINFLFVFFSPMKRKTYKLDFTLEQFTFQMDTGEYYTNKPFQKGALLFLVAKIQHELPVIGFLILG